VNKADHIACILFFLASPFVLIAQSAYFSHITTEDGLTSNNIRSVAIDKKGFLWVGTNDGLNIYDGYSVTNYQKKDEPEMAANNVIHLTVDNQNNVWLGTNEGATRVDEHRRFQGIILEDTVRRFVCRTIMDTKSYGVILYTSLGQFYFNKANKWQQLDWIPEIMRYRGFNDAAPFADDKIIYATDSLVMIMDYATRHIIYEQPFSNVASVCRINENEIAVGIQTGLVNIVDIRTKNILHTYQLNFESGGKIINTTLNELRPTKNGYPLIAGSYSGLFVIENSGKITIHTHNPIDARSITGDIILRIEVSSDGEVVAGSSFAGVSVFNVYNKPAGFTRIFMDEQGKFYDSYLSDIAEDSEGNIWIGAYETTIRWDRRKNISKFYKYYSSNAADSRGFEIRSICVDKQDRVWAGTLGNGLSILDKRTGKYKRMPLDTSLGPDLQHNFIARLMTASDGFIWVGTGAGLFKINPSNFAITRLNDHPQLKELKGKRVNTFLEDGLHRMWIGTQFDGLYFFDPSTHKLLHYTIKEGLSSNSCYDLLEDKLKNIYVAGPRGFSVISKNGKINSYTRAHGLKYDLVGGFLEDDNGNIWMPNDRSLIKYSPLNKTMEIFDHQAGFTSDYYRVNCFLKTQTGEFLLGSRIGLHYFFPDQLVFHPPLLKVNIYQADLKDTVRFTHGNESLSLRYSSNNIIFRFTAINLLGSDNIRYQFMLDGYDKDWQSGVDIREARYSSVPSGNYTFKVKASFDGINWANANNEIDLYIIPPLGQRWWFITSLAAIMAAGSLLFFRYRYKKQRLQKEKLETEQAINYFASSMYAQQSVDNILWDVARNCIGRLQFEDCVIYLLDEEKKVLVQKAAHGPKNPKQFEIDKPIEIPLGKGIVGSVAITGKPEIITDTTKDPRYIVDDERRNSEISVPIKSDGKVIGIIDCEHSKKGFFTQKHLSILTTIASLCANKIVRTKAEQEKQKTQVMLMETERKMTEVEMQALRAQMNPHFIFNCLNSINRYIVKSDQATASLYLTRFARLIRLILDNSNSKNVILSHELEALKLYIEMEALRFDKKFDYTIVVDKAVNPDNVELPPLIIQPYVENAIWHGLLHKETPGCLCISVNMPEENILECIIEDNGVGRQKAKDLKSKSATTRKSLGMKLTEDRLTLLNRYAELNASIDIIDLANGNGEATGTKVILKIPV
jgi:ligand-binding sensor domain-containing protein/putative methionine-R-sulfoxide reductase with GAF domain